MELRIYDDIRRFLGCSEDVPRMLSRYFQLRGPGGPSRSGGFDGSVGPDGSDVGSFPNPLAFESEAENLSKSDGTWWV